MAVPLPSRSLVETLIRQSLYSQLGRESLAGTPAPTLVVNSSARHMHVTQENLEILFGKGAKLTVHKWLYQEGQFASGQTVTLVGRPGGAVRPPLVDATPEFVAALREDLIAGGIKVLEGP